MVDGTFTTEDIAIAVTQLCEVGKSQFVHRFCQGLEERRAIEPILQQILQGMIQGNQQQLALEVVRHLAKDHALAMACRTATHSLLGGGKRLPEAEEVELFAIWTELCEGGPSLLAQLATVEAERRRFDSSASHFFEAVTGLLARGQVSDAAAIWTQAYSVVPCLSSKHFLLDQRNARQVAFFALHCGECLCNTSRGDAARALLELRPGLVAIDDLEYWRASNSYDTVAACILFMRLGLLEEAAIVYQHLISLAPLPQVIGVFHVRLRYDVDCDTAARFLRRVQSGATTSS